MYVFLVLHREGMCVFLALDKGNSLSLVLDRECVCMSLAREDFFNNRRETDKM